MHVVLEDCLVPKTQYIISKEVYIYVSFKYSLSDGSTQMDLDLQKTLLAEFSLGKNVKAKV